MTAGKIFALLALFLLFIPLTNACFVSSTLEIDVEDIPPLTPFTSVDIDADITFEWGFGALFVAPVVIYVEVETAPEWVHVEPSEDSFTVSQELFEGFFGGKESKTIPIKITPHKEIEAYISSPLKIHAYTNGSFLIKESDGEKEIYIHQNFQDRGVLLSSSFQRIEVKKGESEQIYLNLTNECNGDVTVTFHVENITEDWDVSFTPSQQQVNVPSSYSRNNEKTVKITFRGKGEGSEEGMLKIKYFPTSNPEWGEKEESMTFSLKSTEKRSIGGLIGVVVLIIFLFIIFILWKKRRARVHF